MAFPFADLPQPRPPRRVLVFFLGASLAAHAVLIVLAPHISLDSMLAGPEPLEVTIEHPRPVPVEKLPAPPPAERAAPPTRTAPRTMKKPKGQPRELVAAPSVSEPAREIQVMPAAPQGMPEPQPPAPQAEAAPRAVMPPSHSAAYLRNPPPQYPVSSRMAGEEGTVILRVLVRRNGLPGRVEIRKSSGWHNLDAVARDAVWKWRFVPGREGNDPVDATMEVPITFRLKDAADGISRGR